MSLFLNFASMVLLANTMSTPLFQPGSDFLGSGPADAICWKTHEKWWNEHYKPPAWVPPLTATGAKRINLYKATFYCRDIMPWSIWITLPKKRVGAIWKSSPYTMTCDSVTEQLIVINGLRVEIPPDKMANRKQILTDRAFCVPRKWQAQIDVARGNEQCLDYPVLPASPVTFVAWTTVLDDDGLEKQVNIGRFVIKRNTGSTNLNHGHDPKRRWSITGRSSYEYSIMDWGTEGQVWQVCIDNPRMGIKQHDYVTLHNAMVPVGMHPYLEGLRQ